MRPQFLDKFRREFFELVYVLRLTKKGERQFARLRKLTVVDLEAFNRIKSPRQQIEDFGIEPQKRHQNADTGDRDQHNRAPHQAAAFRNKKGNLFAESHRRKAGDRLEAQHEGFRSFIHPHNSILRIAQNFLAQGEPPAGPRRRLLKRP